MMQPSWQDATELTSGSLAELTVEFEVAVHPSFFINKYDNALHASSCTACCILYVLELVFGTSQQMQSSEP